MACLRALFFLIILPATSIASLGTAWADIGRVKNASGEAIVERDGAVIPATPGLALQESDALITGKDGTLGVTFVDNSRFSAGPNSRIELSRFRFNATTHDGQFDSRLQKGSVAIISGQIAKKTPDAMKIRTPSSILGVRGTEFVVEAN
ncbi:FecR family protein [Hwanghaeella sp.]|uniref:FecR family protein n=1 Tax=Hwanghaeella sp. TaxID=2605943 RepID=UPI003CCBE615